MKAQALETAEQRQAFAQGLLAGLQIAWRMALGEATDLNAAGQVGAAQAVVGVANILRDKREELLQPPEDHVHDV